MSELSSADTAVRECASDPRCSVLLQAPAGSGKTTVLTERLLRLLAEVDEPEEILAITFTRKAAAEMRNRVLQALRCAGEPRDELSARQRKFAEAVRARDARRGWNLPQDPGRLRIQTIDSFNFHIANQLTVSAKAGCSLVIAERAHELYERAAQRTLREAQQDRDLAVDVDLLFERLDNHWRNVLRLLADMLHRRGHWLPYVLAHDADALCERVSESLRQIVGERLRAACAQLPSALRAEGAALAGVGELSHDPGSLPSWKQLAARTLTQAGQWRQPGGISRRVAAEYDSAAARDALKAMLERCNTTPGTREILLEVAALPAPALTHADAAALQALSRVLRFAAAQLQAEFASAGRVDHTYVAGAARAALTEAGLPTDLALRTGFSLRHILVDEFQDTSLAQFELLEMLTVSWEPGDGRTLFVVGDPMQSIYQFREAEVGLFLRARDHGIGPVRLQPLQLTRNFRSVPGLIDWINHSFATVFPRNDDLRVSAVAYTPSVPGRAAAAPGAAAPAGPTQPGPAGVQLFPGAERRTETAAITRRIAGLRATEAAASIAVLVASRAHAVPIMRDLEANGIAAIGVEIVPLREVSIVRDLVALLRALSHLGDRAAWLAILRAPWCGVRLATLTQLCARGDPAFIWESLNDPQRLAQCAPAEQARLRRLTAVIGLALAQPHRAYLADWLERTWLRLGAADAYPRQELAHARAFLEVLGNRVTSGEWTGIQDVGRLLNDLYAQPQSNTSNPVQIMTIHRAKGLEFDHVIVPGLDCRLNTGREPLLRWLDLPRAAGGSDLLMAPVPAIGDDEGGDVSAYIKRLQTQRAAHEQVRLLYVAATRARRTLLLTGTPPVNDEGAVVPTARTLLACMWPIVAGVQAFSAPTAAHAPPVAASGAGTPGEPARPAPPALMRLSRLNSRWRLITPEGAAELSHLPIGRRSLEPPQFSWVQETARHIGTIVHGALERFATRLPLPTPAQIAAEREAYLRQLRRQGVPEADLARAASVVIEALTRTVNSERGRWLFAPAHREAHSEWALTGLAAGRLGNIVIDRSFIDADGTRWVVDFKTSRHEGGALQAFLQQELQRYAAQLETYRSLARQIGPQPVRAGLYFPLLDAFRELT